MSRPNRTMTAIRYHSTTSSAEDPSVRGFLGHQVSQGALHSDKAQDRLAKRLSRLQKALAGYDNVILLQDKKKGKEHEHKTEVHESKDKKTDEMKPRAETSSDVKTKLQIPRGLYIHGPVGTGKTMLMDFFFQHVDIPKKQRHHFHAFLANVHSRIHELKQQDLKAKGRNFSIDTSTQNNPIHRVGLELASELSLLCLDEFQVTDIADALILSQLFGVLFRKGTVVVATSNRPPSDLYEGGLNRGYFLPFIDLLQKHCIVHPIKSQIDYRRILSDVSSFFVTSKDIGPMTDELIEQLQGEEDVAATSIDLKVGFQRVLAVKRTYGQRRMACFAFEELCDNDLGAMDYRAIAQEFDIVVLEDIPTLDLEGHNLSRRFITLVDELYEGKCAVLCSTTNAATPMGIFQGASESHTEQQNDHDDGAAKVMGVDVAVQGGMPVGALASVRELAFAFERSSSRLYEMTSRPWWDRVLEEQE